ncbi:MAG: hypothetical protein PHS02_00010 [Candidatus ainarchaeum sp.]|nr:hypothetical protein [Candidatus ainarchaeum sp.]
MGEGPVLAVLFLLVLLFVLAMLAYVFRSPVTYNAGNSSIPLLNASPGCIPGVRMNCTNSLGCSGQKLCVESSWTECVTRRVCTPGQKGACHVNSCEMGYATCDSCGVYVNCTPR